MSDDAPLDEDEPAAMDPSITEELAPDAASSDDLDAAPHPEDVHFRVMHFESVLYDLTDASPMIHLLESESPFRYLVIPVALSDAVALQNAHGAIEGRRPSTHELMTTILTRLQAEVIAARVVRYEGGVFYAELDLMTPRGREVFDCRTSDALAMALRQNVAAPILCAEDVLESYYA